MSASRDYIVEGYLTISVYKKIRATSRKAAIKKARDLATPSLCHQCDGAGTDDPCAWELNGFDDPPDDCVTAVDGKPVNEKLGGAQ